VRRYGALIDANNDLKAGGSVLSASASLSWLIQRQTGLEDMATESMGFLRSQNDCGTLWTPLRPNMTTSSFPLSLSVFQTPLPSDGTLAAVLGGALSRSVTSFLLLNSNVSKAVLEHAIHTSRQLMAAKSPEDWSTVMSAQSAAGLRRADMYWQYLESIVTTAQNEMRGAGEDPAQAPKKETAGSNGAKRADLNPPLAGLDFMRTILSARDDGYRQWAKGMETTMAAMHAPGKTPFSVSGHG
jgi:hypothetical protein